MRAETCIQLKMVHRQALCALVLVVIGLTIVGASTTKKCSSDNDCISSNKYEYVHMPASKLIRTLPAGAQAAAPAPTEILGTSAALTTTVPILSEYCTKANTY